MHVYKCLGFKIDVISGVVLNHQQRFLLRAKTLQVLKILLENREQVVTKKYLLDTIWHDVVVQEQVLTQSIKELRDIFGSEVIKTYPREGYQWSAPVQLIFTQQPIKKITLLALLAICFISVVAAGIVKFSARQQLTVAFLPVENAIPDVIHQWVGLRGMAYLSEQLSRYSALSVVEHDQTLHALEYIKWPAQGSALSMLRRQLNADVLVQTKVTGYPQDFQLHYTLYFVHGVEKGVEFAKTIEGTFDKLSERLTRRYANELPDLPHISRMDFSNESFARGVEMYLRQAYEQAIPLFESALLNEPQLYAARRYLAASHANLGEHQTAITLLQQSIEAFHGSEPRELIRAHLMIGYLMINWPQGAARFDELESAQLYIEQAQVLAQTQQDELFIAYTYEELGKIKRMQGALDEATELLTKALQYHHSFYGQYGQTNALIELAKVAAAQSDFEVAQHYLQQAQTIADENGAPANQIWVLLAKADIAQIQGNENKAEQLALLAQQIAQNSEQPHLVTRVASWFEHQSPYTLN